MSQLSEGFVHTVFFWLKDPNDSNRNELREGLEALAEIPLIQQAFIGTPAATNRSVIDSSYDLAITFVFDGKEEQDIYQEHPDHHKFIKEYSPLWRKVLVYDVISS